MSSKSSKASDDRSSDRGHAGDDHLDFDLMEFGDDTNMFSGIMRLDVDDWVDTKSKPFLRLRDKVSFLLGTLNLIAFVYFLGTHQYVLPIMYSIKFPILVAARYFSYQKQDYHFYLLDFCYYANVLLIVTLWLLNNSADMFIVTYCVINGPLLWAIPIFRNSMVFHSVDKTTSLFIHLTPVAVVFVCRWYLQDNSHVNLEVCRDADCSVNFMLTLVYPVAFFAAHQVLYYVVAHILLRERIERSGVANTSYSYLTSNTKSPVFKLANIFGEAWRRIMFSVWYVIFTAITILPTRLMYDNFAFNFAVLMIMATVALWNGSTFYIDVFTRRYKHVERKMSIRVAAKPLVASSSNDSKV